MKVVLDLQSTSKVKIRALEAMQRKLKRGELILKLISNCIMLYSSEYMKSSFNINAFDDPLTIE